MAAVRELEAELHTRIKAYTNDRKPIPAGLTEAGWLIQELRVAQFAQALGVRGQVSAKRIRRVMDEA